MEQSRKTANLALVGFMGTGKSTVGHLAAAMLHFKFVDTDEMIERRAGKRISEIFALEGEAHFRALEKQLVEELCTSEGLVISTGGGLVTNPENLNSLKKHSLVVCLWASPSTIISRVGHQSHRPLLQCENPLERISTLLEQRKPSYKQSDVLINVDFRSPKEVASHVVSNFRAACTKAQPVM